MPWECGWSPSPSARSPAPEPGSAVCCCSAECWASAGLSSVSSCSAPDLSAPAAQTLVVLEGQTHWTDRVQMVPGTFYSTIFSLFPKFYKHWDQDWNAPYSPDVFSSAAWQWTPSAASPCSCCWRRSPVWVRPESPAASSTAAVPSSCSPAAPLSPSSEPPTWFGEDSGLHAEKGGAHVTLTTWCQSDRLTIS